MISSSTKAEQTIVHTVYEVTQSIEKKESELTDKKPEPLYCEENHFLQDFTEDGGRKESLGASLLDLIIPRQLSLGLSRTIFLLRGSITEVTF